jgi:hypothetical protein
MRERASRRKHAAGLRWAPAIRGRLAAMTGGGTGGNEQLTAVNGLILILLFAVIGVTILRIGQLISIHLFVGLLVLGPVALKLASTGYRFVRYYTGDPIYREKGPPELGLRLIAPVVVLTTVAVFVSGIVLLFEGPSHRGSLVLIHKVSFIVWAVFVGVHILGHLPAMGRSLRAAPRTAGGGSPGAAGRLISIAGALVAGAVLAIVLIPRFGLWTAHGALLHHHHH